MLLEPLEDCRLLSVDPYLVKDINLDGGAGQPSNLTDVNGTLYFSATDPTSGMELWKSDGTSAGAVLVKDIYAGASSSSPSYLTNVNGTGGRFNAVS